MPYSPNLKNSITEDKSVAEKTVKQPETRVDIEQPNRQKQEAQHLPQIHNIIESETAKTTTKGVASNSTRIPKESNVHAIVAQDAMTWANTCEMMNRLLQIDGFKQ